MRKVGGYSMPGFREIPPIDRELAVVGAVSEGEGDIERHREAVAADPAAR
ncbi:hypothetical protein [Nocardia stercoris]|nr:hypothetical protein [Nocardia stercoris]